MRRPLRLLAVVLAAGAGADGCRAHPSGAPDAAVVAPLPPPVVPRGLLARAALRDPDLAWSRIQHGAGGVVALLPATTGELVAGLLGLDASLGSVIDGHATAYAAALGGEEEVGWVLALPLTADGERRLASMRASDAGLTERTEGAFRLFSRPGRPLPAAVAVAPGWVIAARREDDLLRAGPYVFRGLPADATLAPPADADFVAIVPRAALAGPLAGMLSSQWTSARRWLVERAHEERGRHGGRAADFGDPEAIVGTVGPMVEHLIAAATRVDDVHLEARAGEDDVALDVHAVDPGVSDAGAQAAGDARPLEDVAAVSPFAVFWREGPGQRAEDARSLAEVLRAALGPRLPDDQAHTIQVALLDWAQARGDWTSVSLDAPQPTGLWLRAPLAAEGQSSRDAVAAVRALVGLSSLPALRAPLQGLMRAGPAVMAADANGVSMATFPWLGRGGRSGVALGGPVAGVAWRTSSAELRVAAGLDPRNLLAAGQAPGATWKDDERTDRAVSALGDAVTFVALLRPSRLRGGAPSDPSGAAPAVVGWGVRPATEKSGEAGLIERWGRLDLPDGLFTEGVRMAARLFE